MKEVVIKLPESVYKEICSGNFDTDGYFKRNLRDAFKNGTILPEGHGRLGDLDEVADKLETLRDGWNYYGNEYENGMYHGYDNSLDEVMDTPTIIEANKSVERVKSEKGMDR